MKKIIFILVFLIFLSTSLFSLPDHYFPRPESVRSQSYLQRVPEEIHYIDELKNLIAQKEWRKPRNLNYNIIKEQDVKSKLPTLWPVMGGGIITSPFGLRYTPFSRTMELHAGIDIAFGPGVPILAAADGIVSQSETNQGYGILVVVDHAYGFSTFYSHLMRTSVKNGDVVRKGQIIGYMGSTGRSSGIHLHFEVRINDTAVNPRNFMFIRSF